MVLRLIASSIRHPSFRWIQAHLPGAIDWRREPHGVRNSRVGPSLQAAAGDRSLELAILASVSRYHRRWITKRGKCGRRASCHATGPRHRCVRSVGPKQSTLSSGPSASNFANFSSTYCIDLSELRTSVAITCSQQIVPCIKALAIQCLILGLC